MSVDALEAALNKAITSGAMEHSVVVDILAKISARLLNAGAESPDHLISLENEFIAKVQQNVTEYLSEYEDDYGDL